MTQFALCAAVPIDHAVSAPEWLHLLPAGLVTTQDGRGPYRVSDPAQLMAASLRETGGKMVLCENHATDIAAPKGGPSPAHGWIVDLQNRADGIWGKVQWVEPAAQMWKRYRGISPVIAHKQDGSVTAILRATLTNTPNLTGLRTLHTQGNVMDELRTTLIKILDLTDSADDRMIINKVKFLVQHHTGKAVAMQSSKMTHVQSHELATHAVQYQARLARDGITIDLPAAVRAVMDGKAN